MPHTLIKIEGGKISALASSLLADAQIYATNYANQKIEEEIKKQKQIQVSCAHF